MGTAYVALGSNLGERKQNLQQALAAMRKHGLNVTRVSSFIETEPYGVTDQPRFLNGACEVVTGLAPERLLSELLAIETEMGRERKRHWGERNIDLDLLLYDDVIMQTAQLTLPHPDMLNRDFVLLPLKEIAPDAVHPVVKKRICEL